MATTKPKTIKKPVKKPASKVKKPVNTEAVKTVEKKVVAETKMVENKKCNILKEVFAKKYTDNEKIGQLMKGHRIYGAIMGEIIGTMLLTMVILTAGIYQLLFVLFAIIAIIVAVYGLSGSHLNPLVTVGAMVTRRFPIGKGLLYIFSQGLGAAFGLLVINAFRLSSATQAKLPGMTELVADKFWAVAMIELVGAIMIGFFFARALVYKKSPLTFAAVVGSGVLVALLITVLISGNFFSMQNNLMLNPAISLMHQILPSSGDNLMAVMGQAGMALAAYVLMPMIGGAIGFLLADFGGKLSEEKNNA